MPVVRQPPSHFRKRTGSFYPTLESRKSIKMAKTEDTEVDDKLIGAFHLMYDYFPEGVQLVHKSKRIIALNSACASFGRNVGMVCSQHGPPEQHNKGCLANTALKEHKATWLKGPGMTSDAPGSTIFWLHVDGYPDGYIHFGVHCMKHYSAPSSEDEQFAEF